VQRMLKEQLIGTIAYPWILYSFDRASRYSSC